MNVHEIRKRVGHRIKVRRVDKNLNQGELAERIGMTQAQLSEIERGIRPLRVEQLIAIAKVLDCTAAYLLGDEEQTASSSLSSIVPARAP